MKYFDPHLLKKWTGGFWTDEPINKIENFCFDTRKIGKNECFLAIKNTNNDGHNYVKTAKISGAVAAIVEHEISNVPLPQLVVKNTLDAFQNIAKHYRKTLSTKIIGVTGSCGKTSLKELLALLLGDKTFKTPENFNNHLGLPFSITQIDSENHKNAVIEVGISHKNEMDSLANILQPDEAIITNIGPAHLGNFNSLDDIGIEKFKLFNSTNGNVFFFEKYQKYHHEKGHTYVLSTLQKNHSASRLISPKSHCTNIFYKLSKSENGWDIIVSDSKFHIPFLLGSGAVQNFVLAITVALKNNLSTTLIQKRLLQWKPFQNRGTWKTIGTKHYFIDCYNANPNSYADSLERFYNEKSKNSPTCFVLGSMEELGPDSEKYHQEIAEHIALNSKDRFICIGHFCEAIKEGLIKKGFANKQIQYTKTTNEAIPLLQCLPQKYIYLKGSHCYHLENLVAEN